MADISQNPQSNIQPDESNIYIRTMNQDMQNLNQGGGNFSPGLGAEQQPIQGEMSSPTPPGATSFDQSSLNELKQKIQNINSGVTPNPAQNIPANQVPPVSPQMASSIPPTFTSHQEGGVPQNIPQNPQNFYSVPQPSMATPTEPLTPFPQTTPTSPQPNDNIIFNPPISSGPSNMSPNIPISDNQPIGQFNMAAEPSAEASSIPTYTKPKKNTTKLLIPIIIIVVLLGFYFLF